MGSLYLWPEALTLNRDSPVQIQRRFMSVALVCVTSVIYLLYWAKEVCVYVCCNIEVLWRVWRGTLSCVTKTQHALQKRDLFLVLEWMGIRSEGLLLVCLSSIVSLPHQ